MVTPGVIGPTARHRALAHPSRVQLFEMLQERPEGLGVTELAQRSGLHPNTVRVHLDKLTEAGMVAGEPVRRGGRGRPSIRYRAAEPPEGDRYRVLASMLVTALTTGDRDGPSLAAETAGRRWGQRHAAVSQAAVSQAAVSQAADVAQAGAVSQAGASGDAMGPRRSAPEAATVVFDQLGFAPVRDGDRIVLHECPYRDLAAQHPDVICGLHLGLLRGVLDGHGVAGDDAWLDPFVTPTRCVAGLAARPTPETEEHA
jgi:predicted ArsR family transcriptional regulator